MSQLSQACCRIRRPISCLGLFAAVLQTFTAEFWLFLGYFIAGPDPFIVLLITSDFCIFSFFKTAWAFSQRNCQILTFTNMPSPFLGLPNVNFCQHAPPFLGCPKRHAKAELARPFFV
jgi:hypothetical protein